MIYQWRLVYNAGGAGFKPVQSLRVAILGKPKWGGAQVVALTTTCAPPPPPHFGLPRILLWSIT